MPVNNQHFDVSISLHPDPLIAPSCTTIKRGTNVKDTEYTFHNYDKYGNLQYISKNGADPVVYLWGYNYHYPIAKIEGATYTDVKASTLAILTGMNSVL